LKSVQELCTYIFEPNDEQFLQWMTTHLSDRVSPFRHYARRLRSNFGVNWNSFIQPYSNDSLEGKINRLNMIKRVTYGVQV